MATLRADQIEGVEAAERGLSTYKGFLLGDFMGLGKTAQAIELLKRYRAKYESMPVIIVCPAYLLFNWVDELTLWGAEKGVCVIDSTAQILHAAPVYLGSYNMVSHKAILKQLLKMKTSLVICDEGHTFRTWNSARSRYVLGTFANKKSNLSFKAKNVLLLTGTPLVNTIEDLYNIFYRIAPEIFTDMTRGQFLSNFAGELISTPYGLKVRGVKDVDRLQKMLAPAYIARSISEALPPLVHKDIKLKIKGAELEKLLKEEAAFLREHGIGEKDILDAQKMKSDEAFAARRRAIALYKVPLIMPAIAEAYADGVRPIIYFWHRAALGAMVAALEKKYKKAVVKVIHGGVDTKERHEIVKAYQAGSVDFLLATSAMKEGVNLTAGTHVYFAEPPYTYADLQQCTARLHRTGQENPVHAFLFYFAGGIDAHIMAILRDKAHLSGAVVQVKQIGIVREVKQ